MGRRLFLRLLATAALLTGGVFLVAGAPAAAVDSEYGWWSIANAPGGLPLSSPVAPPGAPTDGVYASLGPTIPGVTGPVPDPAGGQVPGAFAPAAVGAIRFPAEVTESAVLMLEVTASSTPPQELSGQLTFGILACPISDPSWIPAQNGSFDDKPTFECGGIASVGAISPDGKQVSWELSPIFQTPSGLYNVAIVVLGQSPYFISFAPPGPTSITIVPSEDSLPAGEGPTADTGPFAPGAVGDPSAGSVFVDAAPFDGGEPTDPLATGGTLPAPTEDAAPSAVAAPELPLTASPSLVGAVPKGRDAWRIFFGMLLLLIGFGLFWTAGQNARAPRLIGPLRGGTVPVEPDEADVAGVRGIGRYAQARVGSPRRLR